MALFDGFVGLFFRRVSVYWIMVMEGAALVENRAGITFGVELYVPWDAPEAVVDIHSEGMVNLGSIPDFVGLTGRQPGAAEIRVLQGRDVRSVRVLVPDSRGLDQSFHDVTIVDMGDVLESAVPLQELSLPAVATCVPSSHGVATAGSGGDARGSQVVVFTAAHG